MTDLVPPVLSVAVPLFDEEESVEELIRRIAEGCRSLSVPFEIVAVNDGSRDQTLSRLVDLSARIPELRVINLFRNFGHMPALTAGIASCRGKAVVVLDGDLQDPPEIIPDFFRRWRSGADVVYGLRTSRGEPLIQRAGTSFFYFLLRCLTRGQIPPQAGTFCLMDRRVVEILQALPERQRYFAGLRSWVGGRQEHVSYHRPDRREGTSKVGMKGLIRLARTAFISFSKTPVRLAYLFSGAVGAAALFAGIFLKNFVLLWIGLLGWSQALLLAVLSEYLCGIFEEVKARPLFFVREEFASGRRVDGLGAKAP